MVYLVGCVDNKNKLSGGVDFYNVLLLKQLTCYPLIHNHYYVDYYKT